RLRRHRAETERHERLMRSRLEAHGASPSWTAEAAAVFGAWLEGTAGPFRAGRGGKGYRGACVTEHVELAAYPLADRLAERADDLDTSRAARHILGEERAMSDWLTDHWDRAVDLTLAHDGDTFPGAAELGVWPHHHAGGRSGAPLLWALGLGAAG